jgi:hypothetical protein
MSPVSTAKLEFSANIAVIVAAGAVCLAVATRFLPADHEHRASFASMLYREGTSLPQLGDIRFDTADKTLLLFFQSTRRYCTEGMPFYQRVTNAVSAAGGKLQFAALSTEPRDVASNYISAHGLRVSVVSLLRPEQFRVMMTPTLIAADRSGRVLKVWAGRLHEDGEREVLATITQ